ncbi:MAG TPA: D-alanyl-D-alanine carboxypeptidase family protein [Blastocatellia bacterium]|nr:D-alanyl-D-alanine carboxypeptidase family protein [Blastocatellia bacterium]
MKSGKGLVIGLAIVLATVGVIFSFQWKAVGQAARIQTAQASSNEGSAPAAAVSVERLSAPAKPAAAASAATGLFASAAARNADLQDSLTWAFGGKSQRGWRIYAPLVGGLIGADSEQTSSDFATQLSRWQQQHGASANGVLDSGTWSQIVANWQANRLKDHSRPTADELVTIPTSECYDPSRPEALRQVERRTYAAYKQMVAAAAADGAVTGGEQYFKVVSALRTPEYQAQLRAQSPNSGRAGLAVNSPHFTGRALDLYVGGEPVSTKDDNRAIQTQSKAYRWLVKNAGRFGFRPYFYEPWHWEYVGK